MSISIKLLGNIRTFTKKIGRSIATIFNKVLFQKKSAIESKIKSFVEKQLFAQPEVQALMSSSDPGSLNAMLGITPEEGTNAVNDLISFIVSRISVNFTKFDDNLNGGLEIIIAGIDSASIPSGIKQLANVQLNWLDWLLTKGDTIIVVGYRYSAEPNKGRTGGGIMKPGGSFRVPPQYSGVEGNNFITRALIGESQQAEISRIIQSEINV